MRGCPVAVGQSGHLKLVTGHPGRAGQPCQTGHLGKAGQPRQTGQM